jgi:putative Holliday junction resolvase
MVGLDVGERRIGVAMSDARGVLASPATTLHVRALGAAALDLVSAAIARLAGDDPVHGIVVGLPRRLDGSPTTTTAMVQRFADALHARTGLPVHLQDERLTSREAESRLALRERSWRARKVRLDAAAAAIILQDFLDNHPATGRASDTVVADIED